MRLLLLLLVGMMIVIVGSKERRTIKAIQGNLTYSLSTRSSRTGRYCLGGGNLGRHARRKVHDRSAQIFRGPRSRLLVGGALDDTFHEQWGQWNDGKVAMDLHGGGGMDGRRDLLGHGRTEEYGRSMVW